MIRFNQFSPRQQGLLLVGLGAVLLVLYLFNIAKVLNFVIITASIASVLFGLIKLEAHRTVLSWFNKQK